jgi:restriction system protein
MGRRGFFAELQHQTRKAERERLARERVAVRAHAAAVREAERTLRKREQDQARALRAAEQDRKRLEKEARESHVLAMEAEAEERTLSVEEIYDELDSLLSSTLGVDDYVDLQSLRPKVEHPPFPHPELESPCPSPTRVADPLEPIYEEPPPPTGLSAVFGKKKHRATVAAAQEQHADFVRRWQEECERLDMLHRAAVEKHARDEAKRIDALADARNAYARDCEAREREVAKRNQELDKLIANLGYGTADAVNEYVTIVMSNSVYPDHFLVEHEATFDLTSAELRLEVAIPPPDAIPTAKGYKYSKVEDEVVCTELPQKAVKDRYTSIVNQVALRSFHEVFESDRRGLIKTVALVVGTRAIDPATGRSAFFRL